MDESKNESPRVERWLDSVIMQDSENLIHCPRSVLRRPRLTGCEAQVDRQFPDDDQDQHHHGRGHHACLHHLAGWCH